MTKVFLTIPNCELSYYKGYIPAIASAKLIKKNKQVLYPHLLTCSYVSLVLRHGQAFSPIYRFSLSDGTIVSAHTKSKLVRSPATNEPQLYMSLHILQRYVSLSTPVSGREKHTGSMRLMKCFGLLEPCCNSSSLHAFSVAGLISILYHAMLIVFCIPGV